LTKHDLVHLFLDGTREEVFFLSEREKCFSLVSNKSKFVWPEQKMEAKNPNWKRDAAAAKKREEKRTRLEERGKVRGTELAVAGLNVGDLFPTSWNKETQRKYNAAVYIIKDKETQRKKDAAQTIKYKETRRKKDAAQYLVKAPQIAAQKEIAFRAAQLAAGVPEEEVCPDYEDIKKEVDLQFEDLGDGRVLITDVEGEVCLVEGIRWDRTYIALDFEKHIRIESCRPFYKTNDYEPWIVQRKVKEGVHLNVGQNALDTLVQFQLRMYVSRHRGPSRKGELAIGRIAKALGWPSTACKDGLFLSFCLCLVQLRSTLQDSFSCVGCCAGGAGPDITEEGRFIDGERRDDVVKPCLTTKQTKNCR